MNNISYLDPTLLRLQTASDNYLTPDGARMLLESLVAIYRDGISTYQTGESIIAQMRIVIDELTPGLSEDAHYSIALIAMDYAVGSSNWVARFSP